MYFSFTCSVLCGEVLAAKSRKTIKIQDLKPQMINVALFSLFILLSLISLHVLILITLMFYYNDIYI